MKQRIPTIEEFVNESKSSLMSDKELVDIIYNSMTIADRNQISKKIGVEIREDESNIEQVLDAIKSKEDVMKKFFPELFEKVNEEAIKSKLDNAFVQKIIKILEKNGLRVTFNHNHGQLTINGGDDELVKFEYYY